jgi:uncharacterized membrane protein YqaE (UPF0057 family)
MAEYSSWEICAIIFAFIFPPLGVFMKRGCCNVDLWLSVLFFIAIVILFTFFFFFS